MRAGDEAEYVAYLRARQFRLHRAAYLLCGDAHLAEDLVQATALTLYRKWRRVQQADNMDAYVHRMLVNQFLAEQRRPWSRVLLSGRPVDRVDVPRMDLAERDAVRAAVAQLGPRQRAVVVLRYCCDLSVVDTAMVLECSTGTVKSQAARALATLRRLLADTEAEPTGLATGKGKQDV